MEGSNRRVKVIFWIVCDLLDKCKRCSDEKKEALKEVERIISTVLTHFISYYFD